MPVRCAYSERSSEFAGLSRWRRGTTGIPGAPATELLCPAGLRADLALQSSASARPSVAACGGRLTTGRRGDSLPRDGRRRAAGRDRCGCRVAHGRRTGSRSRSAWRWRRCPGCGRGRRRIRRVQAVEGDVHRRVAVHLDLEALAPAEAPRRIEMVLAHQPVDPHGDDRARRRPCPASVKRCAATVPGAMCRPACRSAPSRPPSRACAAFSGSSAQAERRGDHVDRLAEAVRRGDRASGCLRAASGVLPNSMISRTTSSAR